MFSIYNFDFNYIDIVSIATIYLIASIYACNTLFFNNVLIGKSFIYAIIALISIMTSFLINIFTNDEIKFLYHWTIPSVIVSSFFFIYISKDSNKNKEKIEVNNYKENYNEEYNYSKTRCNFSHKNCYFDYPYKDFSEVEKKQKEMNDKRLQEIKDFNKGITQNQSSINNDKNNIVQTENKKIENKNIAKQTNKTEEVSKNSEEDVLLSNNINKNDIKIKVNCSKLSGDRKNDKYYTKVPVIKQTDNNINVLDITEKTLEDKIIVQVKKVAGELMNKEEQVFSSEIKQIKSDVQMLRDSLQGVINRMAKLFSLMTAAMKN